MLICLPGVDGKKSGGCALHTGCGAKATSVSLRPGSMPEERGDVLTDRLHFAYILTFAEGEACSKRGACAVLRSVWRPCLGKTRFKARRKYEQ